MGRIMDPDNELEALVDMIYDAALNSELWAGVLTSRDLVASPIYNDWMRPAKFGAAAIGANFDNDYSW
jgi:hypothetical protein